MSGKILIKKRLNYLKSSLLSIIYPVSYSCLNCSIDIDNIGLCIDCKNKIEFCTNIKEIENVKVYSVAYYGYSIKKLILDFKYKSNFNSAEYLGKLLLDKLNDIDKRFDYITYVPSSDKKIKERGFNQCEVLAKYLWENTDIPYGEILKKSNKIKEQKYLTAKDRQENVKKAFSLIEDKKFQGKKILLIDDVITTGATIESCIKELKKIKNIDLTVLVVAQSLD